MSPTEIAEIVKPYENYILECDGMSRVISYLLTEREIYHWFCFGNALYNGKKIPHVWIWFYYNGFNYVIDYRA